MDIKTYNFFGDDLEKFIKMEQLFYKTNYDFSKPHRHNYNELFFFEKGSGNHMIDFNNYKIENCNIHLVSSHKVHRVNRSQQSNGYVLMFTDDYLIKNNNKMDLFFILENEKINLNGELFNEMLTILEKIKTEITKNTFLNEEITYNYLNLIFLKLKQYIQEKNPLSLLRTQDDFYQSFYALLEQNFIKERQTSFYANKMNVEAHLLNKKLKKATGKTASVLIKNRLLLEAKRLLLDFSLNIKEIAIILNFTDQSHFSKFLLKETKLNPTDFRKKLKIYKE